ncbi:hypothetical protein JXA88_04190 [Candidatus Fermentibacteria bacterium]|nr:hypothetical protein [Candidatus Fermentibacteria bacterium]
MGSMTVGWWDKARVFVPWLSRRCSAVHRAARAASVLFGGALLMLCVSATPCMSDLAGASADSAIALVTLSGMETTATPSRFFREERLNALLLFTFFAGAILAYIGLAKKGAPLFIRKIAGLDAVDEAVGRATEMGRKVLYIPGIMSVDNIQTVASMSILGYVAERTAAYGTQLEVPNKDPLVLATAREVVKEAYMKAGRPDYFQEDMVNYVTYDQFAYTAAIQGLMTREKPATNFLIGSFYAESLIMAEAGNAAGAIQVAGTAELAQLPFFVVACDYTLIGEELYAASAYLSREPLILGSIKGQDLVKAALIVLIVVGMVLSSLGIGEFADFFTQE